MPGSTNSNSLNDSTLTVGFYDKVPDLPGKLPTSDNPRKLEVMKFEFKLVGPSRPAWVNGQREVAPDDMADYLMKRLMQSRRNGITPGTAVICRFRRNEVTAGELLKCPPSNDTGGISWIGTELKETGNR